jgi:hypothetical protein
VKTQDFVAELLMGHKGAAVIVPFDPGALWGTRPVTHGVLPWRTGHLVRGFVNGVPFEGWIGRRWGRFFLLVGEELQRQAGAGIGDMLQVVVEPRAAGTAPVAGTRAPTAAKKAPKKAAGKAAKNAAKVGPRPRVKRAR